MSAAAPMPSSPQDSGESHPLRTIREIRASLPEDQAERFDAALADTDIDVLPAMLHRWATLANDCFLDHLLSTPFEGLEFGARSYDDEAGAE